MKGFARIFGSSVSLLLLLAFGSLALKGMQRVTGTNGAVQVAVLSLDSGMGALPVIESKSLRFHRVSTADGLSQTRVAQIAQDDVGFLWFGTQYGLNRFDGYRFKTFTHDAQRPESLGGVYITALSKDRSGTLWIGCDQFLDRFDRRTESFQHFRLDANDSDRDRSSISIENIYEDRSGALWSATGKGLYRLDPHTGHITHYTHDPNEPSTIGSNDVKVTGEVAGAFWIGHSQGLDRFDPVTGRVDLHVLLGESGGGVAFHEDRFGQFWVNFGDGNLGVFHPATLTVALYKHIEAREAQNRWNPITSMLEDRDGTMWFGTGAEGLLKFEREHKRFIRYRTDRLDDKSLPDNRVNTLFQDRAGMIWAGLHETGPAYFSNEQPPFQSLAEQAGQPFETGLVSVIRQDRDKNIWLGTDAGTLRRIDRSHGTASLFRQAEGISVLSIVENPTDILWIGTGGRGLLSYNRRTGQIKRYRHSDADSASLSSDVVDKLLVSHDGTLWAATWDGLSHMDASTGSFQVFKPRFGYRGLNFHAIAEDDDGVLWLGSNLGLYRFDPKQQVFKNFRYESSSPGSLSNNRVNSVFFDHAKTMWIGTQNGLDRFDRSQNRFAAYYESAGLAGNVVSCVLEDGHHALWMSTNNGLSTFDAQRKHFRSYNVGHGLPGLDLTGWGACDAGANGELFFGGFGGSVAFSPEKTFTNSFRHGVTLTDFHLFGITVEPGSTSPLQESITTAKSVTLYHWQNFFSLGFSALSVSDAQTIRYRYMLGGLDENWITAAGTARVANYTGVPPGTYHLRVQAANDGSGWSEPGAALEVRVLPPWWSTWWFRSVCAVCGGIAVLLFHQLRLSQMSDRLHVRFEGRLAERNRIARDLHDTLLQSVHGLLLRLQAVQSLLPERIGEAQQSLRIAIDRAADSVAESRSALYNLRSTRTVARDLVQDLKTLGQDMSSSSPSEERVKPVATFGLLVEGNPRDLHPLVQDEIYYIAREALANAFTHSQATHIELDIRYDARFLRLRVRDDGIGIERSLLVKSGKEGHWGLSGMRERAKGIGATLEFWSELNQGTEIELAVPVSLAYSDLQTREPESEISTHPRSL